MLRPPKDDGAQIRAAAAAAGMSMQAWILTACAEKMQRDGFTLPEPPKEGESQNGAV
jgi:lipoprotein